MTAHRSLHDRIEAGPHITIHLSEEQYHTLHNAVSEGVENVERYFLDDDFHDDRLDVRVLKERVKEYTRLLRYVERVYPKWLATQELVR